MKRSAGCCAVLGLLLAASIASAGAGHDCKGCDTMTKSGFGWCDGCKMGVAYGVPMKSHKLYDALTGEKVDAAKVSCDGCKSALKSNGACCGMTFVDGRAYASDLTATLAKGMRVTPEQVKCAGCKAMVTDRKDGYCKACDAGLVGGVVFKGKDNYARAKEYMALVSRAAAASEKCEACGVAMVTNGKCEHCGVSFKDGKMAKS